VKEVTANLAHLSTSSTGRTATASASARPFSLKSLPAFDDLISKGYAVEVKSNPAGAIFPKKGEEVEAEVTALLWDGAVGAAVDFAQGHLDCTLGTHPLVPGLEQGLQLIPVGGNASITCAPQMGYGSAGSPPLVPPNSFVVFEVSVISSNPTPTSSSSSGPDVLFTGQVPSTARRASVMSMKRDPKVILVPANNTTSSTTSSTDPATQI
jgi:FK506-binding protein 1